MIVPNKMFLNESNALLPSRDCHQFAVDRQKLADFLRERMQNCANASFFNADLLRYELPLELAPSPLPLRFSSRWIRHEKTEIGESAPQNVVFSTKVSTQSCGDSVISLLSSEPSANWIEEHSVLNWEFREFPSSSVGGGALKAVFKCAGELTPANSYAQFQVSDTSLSAAHILLDDQSGFALSVFKKKLQAGKYFCEPAN
uniref:Muniscin C-terminal domain-containing protein n=1 Tax=Globodera rostochiensis TaxID=31243 RepID=A0A914HYT6_GLORO